MLVSKLVNPKRSLIISKLHNLGLAKKTTTFGNKAQLHVHTKHYY